MASDLERREGASGPYWQVEVDANKCSLCEVCGQRCARGAIRSEQARETVSILFSYELCDGCRDCLRSCPEEAMTLVGFEAPPDGPEAKVLAVGDMLRCSVCGGHFAPLAKIQAASRRRGDDVDLIREQCPLCRRTQMVATLIEEKREARGKKAEYRTGKRWRWKPVEEGDPGAPPCPVVPDRPSDQDGLTPGTSGEETSPTS